MKNKIVETKITICWVKCQMTNSWQRNQCMSSTSRNFPRKHQVIINKKLKNMDNRTRSLNIEVIGIPESEKKNGNEKITEEQKSS